MSSDGDVSLRVETPLALDAADCCLVDACQRDFPLAQRPFEIVGRSLGLSEHDTLARVTRLIDAGAVTRVGAVVRPHAAGASTLAALAAPPEQVEACARLVAAHEGVNHNYEREHRWNIWFVATASDRAGVDAILAAVEAETGLRPLDLPLERAFHVDLGFPLFGGGKTKLLARPCAREADAQDRRLLAAIEHGLPLVATPFAQVGQALGWSEQEVRARLGAMIDDGVISRFGLVVRHRAFGFTSNAMTVWDVDDTEVDDLGERFAQEAGVSLCYRRPRRPPDWRFNLFTMIHARDREGALTVVDRLSKIAPSSVRAWEVLFSTRCFKQRGARFSRTRDSA